MKRLRASLTASRPVRPCTVILAACWLLTVGASAKSTPQPLSPGQSLSLDLSGQATQSFTLPLAAGNFVEISVYALQTAVAIRPDDNSAFDSPLHGIGHTEWIILQGGSTGARFELTGDPATGLGRLQIAVSKARPVDGLGALWIAADQASRVAATQAALPVEEREALWGQALAAWDELGHDERRAQAMAALGFLAKSRSDKDAALEWLQRAVDTSSRLRPWLYLQLALYRLDGAERDAVGALLQDGISAAQQLQDEAAESALLSARGLLAHSFGDLDRARDDYQRALAAATRSDYERQRAVIANNVAGIHYLRGEPERALHYFDEAIEAHKRLGNRVSEGETLYNKASLYLLIGDLRSALPLLLTALDINRTHEPGSEQEAFITAKIGSTLFYLGQFDGARNFLARALELHQANDSWTQYARTLVVYGELQRADGNIDRALQMHRDAAARFVTIERVDGEAQARLALSDDWLHQGDFAAAADQARLAVALADTTQRPLLQADARERLASALLARQQDDGVVALLSEALAIYVEQGVKLGEARALTGSARLARLKGDDSLALDRARAAQQAVVDLRAGIPPADFRAGFLARQLAPFDLEIDLLMTRFAEHGDPALAELALSVAERASALTLQERLQQSARPATDGVDLQQAITAKSFAIRQFAAMGNAEERRRAERDLQNLLLTDGHATPASVNQGFTLEAFSASLPEDTSVLRYWQVGERFFWWRIGKHHFSAGQLDGAQALSRDARALHQSLRTPGRADRRARERLGQLLTPLGDTTPARLLLVTHGDLTLIPFEWLQRNGQPLFATTVTRYLPALSLYDDRKRAAISASSQVLIVADPVYAANDPRLADTILAAGAEALLEYPAPLARLPYTAREATTIAALFEAPKRTLLSGFAATRQALLDMRLDRFRVLHLATHGQIDDAVPALSALSLSRVDKTGRLTDSELTLTDIYTLELNAELVVLSACETHAGQRLRGEGLLSLSRGFIAAGARSVVSTLWPVSDKATAYFMQRFYYHLLKQQLTASEALAAAKRDMREHTVYREPYFYAGFILVGK